MTREEDKYYPICNDCVKGLGEECHNPICSYCRSSVPPKMPFPEFGISLVQRPEVGEQEITRKISPIKLAVMFHATYERLAPKFGYETKKETKIFDASSPNGKLMIEVCRELQDYILHHTEKEEN